MPDKRVGALAQQYGFLAKPDLDVELRFYEAIVALRNVSELRKTQAIARVAAIEVEAVRRLLRPLESKLGTLSENTLSLLARTDRRSPVLIDACQDLSAVLDASQASLHSVHRGRPTDPQIDFALRELSELYRGAHQGHRGFSSSADSDDGYKGEFFEFICSLFNLIGIHCSRPAAGKRIQTAIRKTTRKVKKAESQREK